MRISVIIPHFNQEDFLRKCLARLQAQQGCQAEVEIIVVDNGSRQMPEAACAAFPGVRLLRETTPGPGPARNTGAAAATGDILAFIDADCHADQGWLASIEKRFQSPSTQIIGGDVRIGFLDPARVTSLEAYEAIYAYRNHDYIAKGFSGTGNLATRPGILRHVGPFGGIDIAEDRDWGLRSGALGYRIDYVAEMIVFHPARATFRELARKWDRHIAHDYADRAGTAVGKVKWVLRALAIGASPVVEIPTILRSPRVSGLRQRGMAFACLCAIRIYRTGSMIGMLFRGGSGAEVSWRDKS